ncbi:MAG: TraB/GumN family protein [Melioribacteraceae bacterium]|nr:MAG: TraB/GumN family protein [Melioribacteraceae bacterium]
MESTVETKYGTDVIHLSRNGREFILIGTAHISRDSADLVRKVIEEEKPDVVCIELDEKRYKSLSEKKKWEELDLKNIIKEKQLATLLINILLASYQKKLGEKLGVNPGVELLEAANTAKENNIPIELCDRDVRITLRRAWNSMSLWQKLKFLTAGIAGTLEKEELSEEKLKELRDSDILNELMSELGKAMPVLKTVLIDERDVYLSQKIKESKGNKIVAVVGAGHLSGIVKMMESDVTEDLAKYEVIPPVSPLWKTIGYAIPLIIIGAIVYIGISQGTQAASDNAIYWILANGIPSALGSAIAWGHPLTILISFIAAPFTSLTPLIGAGYVAAFVQLMLVPPKVKEFETVSVDVLKAKNWWKNRLLRILLVFILASLGSALGTYVGMFEIVKNLF